MTILVFDKPPAVFIRVRKTGTTSVVRGVFGGRKGIVDKREGDFLPEWRNRLVFAFVRNPFDRLVSCYEMFRSYPVSAPADVAMQAGLTLAQVIDIAGDDSIPLGDKSYVQKLRQHALAMTHPSYHIHEAGFIGRFETFDQDYQRLRAELGLRRDRDTPHMRATPSRDYRSYFNADTRAAAETVFAQDLARFSYEF